MTESQLELAICQRLAKEGFFVVKLKDQSAMRDGSYRKGHSFQIRGVPDLVVFGDNGATWWLEVKTKTGKVSKFQERFHSKISELGHNVMVVRSVSEALSVILSAKSA